MKRTGFTKLKIKVMVKDTPKIRKEFTHISVNIIAKVNTTDRDVEASP